MTHTRLKHLAKSLPAILIQDRALKTVSIYVRAYKAWRTWAVHCEATPLPVDPAVSCTWSTLFSWTGLFPLLTLLYMELAGSTRRVAISS